LSTRDIRAIRGSKHKIPCNTLSGPPFGKFPHASFAFEKISIQMITLIALFRFMPMKGKLPNQKEGDHRDEGK
jgi:hypothetical protein